MELSKKERLILYNQYEIMRLLDPDDENLYKMRQKILENGYQHEYDKFNEWFSDDMPEDASEFVWEVLEMYRDLHNAYNKLTEQQQKEIGIKAVRFDGFDGNNEGKYYSYADFILKDMERYKEISDYCKDTNSHAWRIDKYDRMLGKWRQIREHKKMDIELDIDEIKHIVG
jgi:uncharacterized protein